LNKSLQHGEKIERIFMQERNAPSPIEEQLLLFYALKKGGLDFLTNEQCNDFKKKILLFSKEKYPRLVDVLKEDRELNSQEGELLRTCVAKFFESY